MRYTKADEEQIQRELPDRGLWLTTQSEGWFARHKPRPAVRQIGGVVAISILGGTGAGLTSGSVHEAIGYGTALLTGAFLALGLAKR